MDLCCQKDAEVCSRAAEAATHAYSQEQIQGEEKDVEQKS
jgi:hypothetical protein